MSSIFPVDQLAGSRLKDWKATPATGPKLNRENYTMTRREDIVAALDKHGPMTCERLGAHVDVKHLASLLSGLAKAGVLKKNDVKRGATFALPSQSLPDGDDDAPPPSAKTKRAPKAARPAAAAAVPASEPAAAANGHGASYAITDAGTLALRKADDRLDLTPEEFARLRDFIEKTDPIWSPKA
jgi:hypothetical protein